MLLLYVILQLARQGNVFATDAILTTLMCCTRSSYPWDIVVQKVKNKIFLDRRDDSNLGMRYELFYCLNTILYSINM